MPKTQRWKTYRARNEGRIPWHTEGSVNLYDNYACRCLLCRAAKKVKMDLYRKRLIRAIVEDRRSEGT